MPNAVKPHNCLHVMSLWKQIKRGDGIDDVAAGKKFLQIARKRSWIAGDIRDLRRPEDPEFL